MTIEQVSTKELDNISAMIDEARALVGDGSNIENVIVIIATKDAKFHTLTDLETPMTITMAMMEGAAKAIWEQKLQHVKDTDGPTELVS